MPPNTRRARKINEEKNYKMAGTKMRKSVKEIENEKLGYISHDNRQGEYETPIGQCNRKAPLISRKI